MFKSISYMLTVLLGYSSLCLAADTFATENFLPKLTIPTSHVEIEVRQQNDNEPMPIKSFGVELGKPYKDFSFNQYDLGQSIKFEPSEPMKDIFNYYSLSILPNNKVSRINASGDIDGSKYSCPEVAALLSKDLLAKYDNVQLVKETKTVEGKTVVTHYKTSTRFKIKREKLDEYIYLSDKEGISILCMGNYISYQSQLLDVSDSVDVPLDRVKNIKSTL